MPAVNPTILSWARDSAGLSREAAAGKLSLGSAHGKTAVERLKELESGVQQPTRPTLVKMAKQYRRPLVTFYLAKPPGRGDQGTDFRGLFSAQPPGDDATVQALVRQVIARQSILHEVLADDEAEEVAFIGTLTLDHGHEAALDRVHELVGGAAYPSMAPNTAQAFDSMREAVHQAGVFVVLKGDLGSHHSAIDTEAFRGFALADPLAPFIVVNDNDARAAWSFTLLHELVHLLLGDTGISGSRAESRVERFCNDVASEYLLPQDAIGDLEPSRLGFGELVTAIGGVANAHNVSRALIAYRLFRAGEIDAQGYGRLVKALQAQWQNQQETRRERARASEGGPSFYKVKRHRAGRTLLDVVRRSHLAGDLSTTRAALALGVEPTQVQQMLAE